MHPNGPPRSNAWRHFLRATFFPVLLDVVDDQLPRQRGADVGPPVHAADLVFLSLPVQRNTCTADCRRDVNSEHCLHSSSKET